MAVQKKPSSAKNVKIKQAKTKPKAKASKPKAKTKPKAKAEGKQVMKKPSAALVTDGDASQGGFQRTSSREIADLIERSTPYTQSMRPKPLARAALKVLSWNVNGFSSLVKSRPNAIKELISKEDPDVLFLQETKLQSVDCEKCLQYIPVGYESRWVCSVQKLGYSGVAAIWKKGGAAAIGSAVGLKEADDEGRFITVELPRFFVVGCYVPNAGEGLKRLDFRIKQWEPTLANHIKKLQAKKPVIYCGDLNVCHKELDLHGNHGANSKGPGYTPEERDAMTRLLAETKMVDTFRYKHANARAFSYWGYRFNCRKKNLGWRLDYCLAPVAFAPRVHDAFILTDVQGSDHCPVGLVLM